jgi:prophage tail gpP-like protein
MSALPKHTVSLDVDGKRFTSWTGISITRSIEQASASFTLDAFEGASAKSPIIVRPQSAAKVTLSTDGGPAVTLIDGYVDDVTVSAGKDSTGVSIVGRSKTADLIDCMDPDGPHRWTDTTVLGIAQSLAAGYGVDVVAEVDTGRSLARFASQQGETLFATIERAARLRSLLVTDDAQGRLVLTRASSQSMTGGLRDGTNIMASSCAFKGSERFGEIRCRGQRATDSNTTSADAASVEASAGDAWVQRRRVLVIRPEGRTDPAACLERAAWEMATRYGRSVRISVTVPGWTNAAGELWTVNRLQHVRIDRALVNSTLLIVAVTFTRGLDGTTTTLEMQPAEAFAQLDLAPISGRKRRPVHVPAWLDATTQTVGVWRDSDYPDVGMHLLTTAQVKAAQSKARATK